MSGKPKMDKYVYLVMNKFTENVIGVLLNEEIHNLFVKQRDMSSYFIEKVKWKDVKKAVENRYLEALIWYDIVIFPTEEEYYIEAFDQMIMDMEHAITAMIRDIISYLKFKDKEEYQIVYQFLEDFYRAVNFFSTDESGDIDPETVLKIRKLIQTVIDVLN